MVLRGQEGLKWTGVLPSVAVSAECLLCRSIEPAQSLTASRTQSEKVAHWQSNRRKLVRPGGTCCAAVDLARVQELLFD